MDYMNVKEMYNNTSYALKNVIYKEILKASAMGRTWYERKLPDNYNSSSSMYPKIIDDFKALGYKVEIKLFNDMPTLKYIKFYWEKEQVDEFTSKRNL